MESRGHEKVNAWICARPITHHDPERVIPVEKKKDRDMRMHICRDENEAFIHTEIDF